MSSFHVSRSTEIQASPEAVFDVIADFGSWPSWSPWLSADANAQLTIPDDASTVGAVYSWQGDVVGQGEIEHRRLERGSLIEDEIRFVKPFRSVSHVSFDFAPSGEGTRVTWHMRGSLPWFLFWMKPQMEIFIGMDYVRGLKMLKDWVETGEVLSKTVVRGVEDVGPMHAAGVRQTRSMADIGPAMHEALGQAKQLLEQNGLPTDGQMLSVYHDFNLKAQTLDYTAGFAIRDLPATTPTKLSLWSLPSVQALAVEHHGSYDHLANSWSAANQWVRYKKLKQSRVGAYEVYLNTPDTTTPAELRTDIYLPLK